MFYKSLFPLILLLSIFTVQPTNAQAPATLIGTIIDETTRQPIPGATISIGDTVVGTSDVSGGFIVSQPVSGDYQPVTLVITAEGYGTRTLMDEIIYPASIRNLKSIPLGSGDRTTQGTLVRTPEDILAATSLDFGLLPGIDSPNDHISHEAIPATIKVGLTDYLHCSDWLAAGQPINEVIEMDLQRYIENVVPNEWIRTWPEDSLKAGAVAAKMFAWWRINLNNPRPQGADVVDNTCDQVYLPVLEPVASTDAAIEATWAYRMRRDGRVREIHYLAHDWQCEQAQWYPAHPCMGQWGSKALADEGYSWQDILAFYFEDFDLSVTPNIPIKANTILNSQFDLGLEFWDIFGPFEAIDVQDSVLGFHRNETGTDAAIIAQDMDYAVAAGSSMRLKLKLGNSSDVDKTISLYVLNASNPDQGFSCTFTLYAGMPLMKYKVWGAPQVDWGGVRLEMVADSPDGLPEYLLDKVKVQYRPAKILTETLCEPPGPGRPLIVSPTANEEYRRDFTVNLQSGQSNYRPDYAPAYHVQVSTTPNFAIPVFDNGANLSESLSIPVSVPIGGTYYVRARQFDGIDLFGKWTKNPVRFTALNRPGKPFAQAPNGAVDGKDLRFVWSTATETDQYRLKVTDPQGSNVLNQTFTAAQANCDVSCAVDPLTLNLALGKNVNYRWTVTAENSDAQTSSDTLSFTADLPGKPTNIAPLDGAPVSSDVTLEWAFVPLADLYKVVVKDSSGEKVVRYKDNAAAFNCDATSCTANLSALGLQATPGETYRWKVKTIQQTPKSKSKSAVWRFTVAAVMGNVETRD